MQLLLRRVNIFLCMPVQFNLSTSADLCSLTALLFWAQILVSASCEYIYYFFHANIRSDAEWCNNERDEYDNILRCLSAYLDLWYIMSTFIFYFFKFSLSCCKFILLIKCNHLKQIDVWMFEGKNIRQLFFKHLIYLF